MYPLDFEEFMMANGIGDLMIQTLYRKFQRREPLSESLHLKMLDLFRKYLLVGGLPEAVNEFLATRNMVRVRKVQKDVNHLYGVDAARYEAMHRRLKIQRIYDMIPSNLESKKKRIVAKDIEGKAGSRMSSYADEFDYLIASGIALEVKAVSKPCFPLVENSGKNLLKLYMNDVGILTGLFFGTNIKPVMDDISSINLGSVYESVVAQELRAHGYDLYYYDNKKIGEVDYLIDDMDHMSVMPLEIKSGKDYQVHRALDKFLKIEEYKVHEAFVLSNAREVEVKNGITYMPIYYVSFFHKMDDGEVLL